MDLDKQEIWGYIQEHFMSRMSNLMVGSGQEGRHGNKEIRAVFYVNGVPGAV